MPFIAYQPDTYEYARKPLGWHQAAESSCSDGDEAEVNKTNHSSDYSLLQTFCFSDLLKNMFESIF